jgi:hypothetical protein
MAVALLNDVIYGRMKMMCAEHDLKGPPPPFTVKAGAAFLRAQLQRLVMMDDVGDYLGELADAMARAHRIAPWRLQTARLKGVECPECHASSLVRYGGDEHVTCTRCNCVIEPGRYLIWTRMLMAERAERKVLTLG